MKDFKIFKKIKHTQIFILPTIIFFPSEDYGGTCKIKGWMFCWLFWTFQVGNGIYSDEYVLKELDLNSYIQWFNHSYNKKISTKNIEDILNFNKDLRNFLERSSLNYYYPKIILAKELLKQY